MVESPGRSWRAFLLAHVPAIGARSGRSDIRYDLRSDPGGCRAPCGDAPERSRSRNSPRRQSLSGDLRGLSIVHDARIADGRPRIEFVFPPDSGAMDTALLLFHGNNSNSQSALSQWMPVVPQSWLLATLTSRQPSHAPGSYLWSDSVAHQSTLDSALPVFLPQARNLDRPVRQFSWLYRCNRDRSDDSAGDSSHVPRGPIDQPGSDYYVPSPPGGQEPGCLRGRG